MKYSRKRYSENDVSTIFLWSTAVTVVAALFGSSINNQTWQCFTHVFVKTDHTCSLCTRAENENKSKDTDFCQQIVVLYNLWL